MATLEMVNRPIKAGVYTMTSALRESNVSLQQAQEIVKSLGAQNSLAANGNGLLGMWRSETGDGRYFWNTQPPKEADCDTLKTAFIPGAALAFMPTGSPYVTTIFNSLYLAQDVPTPAGWTPQTTIYGADGNPIRETSATGRTVDLTQTGGQLPGQSQPATYQSGSQAAADYSQYASIMDSDQYDQYDLDDLQESLSMRGLQGIGQALNLANGNGSIANGNMQDFESVPAIGPLAAALIPSLIKGAFTIGALVLGYFLVRKLLSYIWKIVYTGGRYLYNKAKEVVDSAQQSLGSAFLPIAIGGSLLAAAIILD